MEDSKQVWYSMDLKKTNQEGIYIISFGGFKNNKSISKSYRVSPVFTGKDYALAMKEYTARFEQFENKKKEIEAQRIEEERQQKIAAEKVKAEWAKQQAEWAKQQVQWKNQQELIRTANTNPFSSDPSTSYIFSVNKLGWANIDRLYSNPATKEVEFTTIVQRQQDYNSISITMLFDKEQIYLPGYQKKDLTFGFTHADYEKPKLPVGETATIIVTGYMDGRLNYAMEKVTISEKQTVVLKMQQTTEKELKALVEARI